MSDSDFVDVGDELVVSISGYPVTKAQIIEVRKDGVVVEVDYELRYLLPLDFKQYDTIDGYGHHSQPLSGVVGDVEL